MFNFKTSWQTSRFKPVVITCVYSAPDLWSQQLITQTQHILLILIQLLCYNCPLHQNRPVWTRALSSCSLPVGAAAGQPGPLSSSDPAAPPPAPPASTLSPCCTGNSGKRTQHQHQHQHQSIHSTKSKSKTGWGRIQIHFQCFPSKNDHKFTSSSSASSSCSTPPLLWRASVLCSSLSFCRRTLLLVKTCRDFSRRPGIKV